MPDRRKHRGKHPADESLFSDDHIAALRRAVAEYSWLLTREYAEVSALKLVGDRYGLTVRQRMAVMRCACSDQAMEQRAARLTTLAKCGESRIGIDGYNLLITIESALSGGLVIVGRDGCYRDLASVHGTYRKVEETVPALEAIIDFLTAFNPLRIDWYLDRPVSNSGRLKALMAELLEARSVTSHESTTWNIELVDSPDAVLAEYHGTVATSDSAILDECDAWVNLAAEIIDACINQTWKVDVHETAT